MAQPERFLETADRDVAVASRRRGPAYETYRILQFVFVIAPIIAGLDKFFHLLVNWDQYLAPVVTRVIPVAPHTFMMAVGVVEIVAGILVAVAPQVFGYIVAAWLIGIIVNLLLVPGYYDIALRDLGLALSAFGLARLARQFRR